MVVVVVVGCCCTAGRAAVLATGTAVGTRVEEQRSIDGSSKTRPASMCNKSACVMKLARL